MSFVGPRPEVPKYVELFASDYRDILSGSTWDYRSGLGEISR